MNAFEQLGISREADTRQIRIAFRHQARIAHPDHGGDADGFIQLHRAYKTARSVRAATKSRPSPGHWPGDEELPSFRQTAERPTDRGDAPDTARYGLAEIAYRFELGRPGHTPRSFIAAIDTELHPDADPLPLTPDQEQLVAYLIERKVDLALIVAAIVREIDNARR